VEHAVPEYPVIQGRSPSVGWRRLGRAFTALTASALALLILTAEPDGANAQTGATPIALPAVQANAACGSSKGTAPASNPRLMVLSPALTMRKVKLGADAPMAY
jgi:hypothetical protein